MCFTISTKPTNINQIVIISGIEQEHYTPMLRWEKSDQLIAFEFCFFLYSFFLFTLKWNVMQQKKKPYTLVCIPWRNYQSLTDFLIDKSDFENTSRQISKVMYCLTVYVPCQCYCFWFNRNYFTHLVWPNLKPYHNLFWNALFKFLSWSFSMSYCISNLEHFRWQF